MFYGYLAVYGVHRKGKATGKGYLVFIIIRKKHQRKTLSFITVYGIILETKMAATK